MAASCCQRTQPPAHKRAHAPAALTLPTLTSASNFATISIYGTRALASPSRPFPPCPPALPQGSHCPVTVHTCCGRHAGRAGVILVYCVVAAANRCGPMRLRVLLRCHHSTLQHAQSCPSPHSTCSVCSHAPATHPATNAFPSWQHTHITPTPTLPCSAPADQLQPLLPQYTAICSSAAAPASGDSDEFLYGRAGTLFGALLLRQQVGATAVPDAALTALAQQILSSGEGEGEGEAAEGVERQGGR